MRCKTVTRFALTTSLAVLAGCAGLPGLSTSSAVLSGTISGTGVTSATKLAVYFGPASPTLTPDTVVSIASGAFSYAIPSGQTTVSLVPFQDQKGDGQFDAGDPNALDPNSCPDCNYIQAVESGGNWTVSILGGSGSSQTASLSSANIQFNT